MWTKRSPDVEEHYRKTREAISAAPTLTREAKINALKMVDAGQEIFDIFRKYDLTPKQTVNVINMLALTFATLFKLDIKGIVLARRDPNDR